MSFENNRKLNKDNRISAENNILAIQAWKKIIAKMDIPVSVEINTDGKLLFKFNNNHDMINFGQIIKQNFTSKLIGLFVPQLGFGDGKNQFGFSINNISLKDFSQKFQLIIKEEAKITENESIEIIKEAKEAKEARKERKTKEIERE